MAAQLVARARQFRIVKREVSPVDLFDVIRACFRRWYVVLPLLAITAGFSYHTYASVKPVYYSNAVLGIVPPNNRVEFSPTGGPVARNGLLDIGGAAFIPNLMVFGLREAKVAERVVANGGIRNYVTRMFPAAANSAELPLVMIEATAPTSEAAAKTVNLLVAEAGPVLTELQQQAGVEPPQMVNLLVVAPPSAPAAGTPSRTRATLALFMSGLGLTVIAGVVFDAVMSRTGSRKKVSRKGHPQPAPTPVRP